MILFKTTVDGDIPFTEEEILQASLDEQKFLQEQSTVLKQTIIDSTQLRLDTFARTKGYDGILSLCTYATDVNPIFAAEGQRGVELRSQTWATLYNILAEVEAGTRPMPSGFADIESELPELTWQTSQV